MPHSSRFDLRELSGYETSTETVTSLPERQMARVIIHNQGGGSGSDAGSRAGTLGSCRARATQPVAPAQMDVDRWRAASKI